MKWVRCIYCGAAWSVDMYLLNIKRKNIPLGTCPTPNCKPTHSSESRSVLMYPTYEEMAGHNLSTDPPELYPLIGADGEPHAV